MDAGTARSVYWLGRVEHGWPKRPEWKLLREWKLSSRGRSIWKRAARPRSVELGATDAGDV